METVRSHSHQHHGFTLIELLVYVAIVAVVLTAVVAFLWDTLVIQSKLGVQQEVHSTAQVVHDRISAELFDAESIISLAASDICIESRTSQMNPVRIYLQNEKIMLGWGGGGSDCSSVANTAALTSDQVRVTSLEFSDVSDGNLEFISFSLDLEFVNNSGRQEWSDSTSIQGGVALR